MSEDHRRRAPGRQTGRSALIGTLATLAAASTAAIVLCFVAWPGVIVYDSVDQYRQALSGRYTDWHPPVMAWLWHVVRWRQSPAAPMLLGQISAYWVGLGLIAAAAWRADRRVAACLVLLAGAFPILLNWLVVVEKDAQCIGALTLGVGALVFRQSTTRRPWRLALAILGGIAFAYAALVRANAVFAVVPIVLAILSWLSVRRAIGRLALLALGVGLAIVASGPINHNLIGASRSDVARVLPVFDLAGIAHFADLPTMPDIPAADWAKARAIHCYTPFYWDPFGDSDRCGAIGDRLVSPGDPSPAFHNWLLGIAHHPLAYAKHRFMHLNSTLRFFVPADLRSAAAPASSEPNDIGLGSAPSQGVNMLAGGAGALARTPWGAPWVWLVAAIGLRCCWATAPTAPIARAGSALAFSGIVMTASFAVVSIASDLRYHLWLMLAILVSAALLPGSGASNRRCRATLATLAAAAVLSIILRGYAPAMPV